MWIQYHVILLIMLLLSSCSNVVPATSERYIGTYSQVNAPAGRITITKEGEVFEITYRQEGEAWIGSGYEAEGKLVAVLKMQDSEAAEFATLSLAGEDQLFIVSRNLEGDYKWDGYFKEVVE